MERPVTRYAWNGEVALAYQVLGDGPVDLVYLQGWASNVEANWDVPPIARWLRELSQGVRLVMLDRRGYGCSDRFSPFDVAPLEVMVEDLLVVLNAVGSERPVLFAWQECGFLALQFAASHPDRVLGLALYGAAANWRWSEETPWQWDDAQWNEYYDEIRRVTDDPSRVRDLLVFQDPDHATDPEYASAIIRYMRFSSSPGTALAETRKFSYTDVRHVLPVIQTPTLLLHRIGDDVESVESSRHLAKQIGGAELVELPGAGGPPWFGDTDRLVTEVGRFIRVLRAEEAALDRVLATVLFTDIVGSTETAARLGDRAWKQLLERHDAIVRALIARYRGRQITSTGDGVFATFPGPMRAVHCAMAIIEAMRPLGLEIRAGVHTGECEQHGDNLAGIGVHVGARVAAAAGAGEVLVSETVPSLVAGSDLAFEDRGEHTLKGVPEAVHVYRATRAPSPVT